MTEGYDEIMSEKNAVAAEKTRKGEKNNKIYRFWYLWKFAEEIKLARVER